MLTEEEAYTFNTPASTFSSDLLKAVHNDSFDFGECADVVFILTNEQEDNSSEKAKVCFFIFFPSPHLRESLMATHRNSRSYDLWHTRLS